MPFTLVDSADTVIGEVVHFGIDNKLIYVRPIGKDSIVPFNEDGPLYTGHVLFTGNCENFYFPVILAQFPLASKVGNKVFAPQTNVPTQTIHIAGIVDRRNGECVGSYHQDYQEVVPAVEVFDISDYTPPFRVTATTSS